MIAITGANGNLGKATLSSLLQKTDPTRLVALVRDPQKLADLVSSGIQIRKADYNDPGSLYEAFESAEQVLQISSSGSGPDAVREEGNVVHAAAARKVKHIVYTGTVNPPASPLFMGTQTCVQTEEAIRRSGMSFTFFRNSMYIETIPIFIGEGMQTGQIFYPAGQGKISFVSRNDIAEALSNVLLDENKQSAIYDITGPQAFTFKEIADLLGKSKGIQASYTDIPAEIFVQELENSGVSPEEISFHLSMASGVKANEFACVSDALEKLLGRPRITVSDYLRL